MDAVIVAAGRFPRKAYPLYLLASADVVVCCDGALASLQRRGIVPDVVVGDLDSVSPASLERYGGTVVHDPDQETNDLTKAFRCLMERWPDVDRVHILAATGRSEAHTVGNMSLLMQYEQDYHLTGKGISVEMVSDWSTMFAVSDSVELHVGEGRKVSLFANDSSLNIVSSGLVWPTDRVVFDNWWKAALNRAAHDVISLRFNHPAPVLVVLD